jgi:hypothetical protein
VAGRRLIRPQNSERARQRQRARLPLPVRLSTGRPPDRYGNVMDGEDRRQIVVNGVVMWTNLTPSDTKPCSRPG